MYKYFIFIVFLLVSTIACKNNSKEKPVAKTNTTDTVKVFPIVELLQNDADDVQKTPYYLYKITKRKGNKTKDSVVISREEFAKIATPVLNIHLDKKNFREDAFQDLNTQSFTIINTSINSNAELRSITALLNDETNKLKTAFIVFEKNYGDSTVKRNYYWKANKSLSVATSVRYKSGLVKEETQFINWNDRDE